MADLVVTAGNVVAAVDATTIDCVAGAAVTAGQTVYRDSVSRKVAPADANSPTADARVPLGIALNGGALNQPITVQIGGGINPGAAVGVGIIYVQSANPGSICPAADLASGHWTSVIGIGTTANNIKLGIQFGGVAVP